MVGNLPATRYNMVQLAGGLDLVTPTLSLSPGVARDASNFEASLLGGYTRILGYERYSGQTAPSFASYSAITAHITSTISAGNTITGATSGATGKVIFVNDTTIIYTRASGTFQVGENITVAAVVKASVTALGAGYQISAKTNAQYTALAADEYRSSISAVPGSGPIRGVAFLNNTVYAWRNNAGGTAMAIYKSSGSGWTAVPLGYQVSFTAGISEIAEGNTVTGLTSGATGVVTRVAVQSGTWAASTAAGRLVFATITGTFQAAETLRVGATNKATCSGAQSAITLSPGGRVEALVGNVRGTATGNRIYGCDGVNKGFEFDGAVYVPIVTGMTADTPTHVTVHKQQLFFSFGGSVQFSTIGDPYLWSAVLGAGEIVLPGNVTAMQVMPGDQSTGALAIYSNNDTYILYGSSSADYKLQTFNIGTGAKAYSVQNLESTYVFDDRGVLSLATTLNYGNFSTAALTMNIQPFTQARRTLVSASSINRDKSQYRVFFSDGSGLFATIVGGKNIGAMPVLFPNPVICATEGQTSSGNDTVFFGSDNGHVYQMDVGTSFDGSAIAASLTLSFNAIGSPRVIKRFLRASVDATGDGFFAFDFTYDLGYASANYEQPGVTSNESISAAAYWDSFTWDNFYWDGRSILPTEVDLFGSAENIAVRISSSSNDYTTYTINSLIIHYMLRRGLR